MVGVKNYVRVSADSSCSFKSRRVLRQGHGLSCLLGGFRGRSRGFKEFHSGTSRYKALQKDSRGSKEHKKIPGDLKGASEDLLGFKGSCREFQGHFGLSAQRAKEGLMCSQRRFRGCE